ncbi:MAG: hypothetical protein K1X87_10335, partial [Dehalococcoidia bacterium]|nr:hypothetical protein [Dehalococcoidia bacterium]
MSDGQPSALPPHPRERVAPLALVVASLVLVLIASAPVVALAVSLRWSPAAAANDDKVTICHQTGGSSNTIEV